MIKTLNPYNTTEKTAEIMSRYRPIAPKPEVPGAFPASDQSQNIRQTTFLRNVWPQLQSRPTRTRKRGRATPLSPPSLKRSRTLPALSYAQNLSLQGFASTPLLPQHSISALGALTGGYEEVAGNHSLVTLPLLPCPSPAPALSVPSACSDQTNGGSEINFIRSFEEEKAVELDNTVSEIPEEKDFLRQLQGPVPTCGVITPHPVVITPHPVRPVGSSIRVGCINEAQSLSPKSAPKKPDELEKEVESEVLPAVISDSNNKVRMANSAYKELIGQPECPWLDSMVTGDERLGGRRIGGEVMLHLSDAAAVAPSSKGFSCWVRIEWGSSDGKKNSVAAFCDVIRLSCVSKDYLFTWRFHTKTRDAANPICISV